MGTWSPPDRGALVCAGAIGMLAAVWSARTGSGAAEAASWAALAFVAAAAPALLVSWSMEAWRRRPRA